jgi:16S rRNA (guanine(966)-N(2))-methyltransferase RsmD
MRVIAGRYKGRRLKAPAWEGLRPTSDRLKETLFNVLGEAAEGARVLDGFAGSGALGIEALSRGASHVTFVDDDRRAAALIEENLRHCGISGGYVIIRGSFAGAVRRVPADQAFDLVVLDPPYEYANLSEAFAAAEGCLSPDGLLVLEHARRRDVPEQGASFRRIRVVTAGDSALSFYRTAGDAVRQSVEAS